MGCKYVDAPMTVEFGEVINVPGSQTEIISSPGFSITETPDEHGGTILEISAVDLSHDTVTPSSLLCGYTAHNSLGEPIVGRASKMLGCLDIDVCFNETTRIPITDYLKLINKPTIDGVEISGDLTLEDLSITKIFYNTSEYWVDHEDLVGEAGCLYIYSDAFSHYNPDGTIYYIPSIKIGDGTTLLSETQFIGGGASGSSDLEIHMANEVIHVSEEDRKYWDNKVSMYVDPDNAECIVFTSGSVPETGEDIEEPETVPASGEVIQLVLLSSGENEYYNMTWVDARDALKRGDALFLVITTDEASNVYNATSATFDFSLRKYVLRLANAMNEYDRIVIFADNQTGHLHP